MKTRKTNNHADFDARKVAIDKTINHISRVRELLNMAARILIERGLEHDSSKFDAIELEPLAEMERLIAKHGQAPFGSEEYNRRLEMLRPMLEHHYAHNRHHPEHHDDGVDGMDLFDVVEMFMDWKAASERGEESFMGLTKACERFRISPQMERILKNTADNLDFKHE